MDPWTLASIWETCLEGEYTREYDEENVTVRDADQTLVCDASKQRMYCWAIADAREAHAYPRRRHACR